MSGVSKIRARAGFLSVAVALFLTLLLTACGSSDQAADKMYNIGIYFDSSNSAFLQRLDGLKDQLKSLGYVEGKNITLHTIDTTGMSSDQQQTALKDFASKGYDAYWLVNTNTAATLKGLVADKPIIVAGMPDSVTIGLIKSNEKPGVNVTGVDNLNTSLSAKRLELLNKVAPSIHSVYLLYNPNPVTNANLPETRSTAQKLGITLIEKPVANKDDSKKAVATFKASEAGAILTMGLTPYGFNSGEYMDAVKREKLLLVGVDRNTLNAGALFSYGANNTEVGKQSTEYLVKVLHGSNPAEMPVLFPNKYELVLNQKMADQLGMKFPEGVVSSADDIVK